MTKSYKQYEAALRKTVHDNVKPLESVKTINLQIYNNNMILKRLFIKNGIEKREIFVLVTRMNLTKWPVRQQKHLILVGNNKYQRTHETIYMKKAPAKHRP